MHFYFTFLFCYFIFKKTQFHYTKHFNFNSSLFCYISNHKNHNFIPIIIYFFQNSKIQKNTIFHKFTQNTHFTPISFLSPQIVHLDSSSHITPHHCPTHHHSPPKIIQKSHKKLIFHKKIQITLSYSPLNLILHTWWPSYSRYKYQTTTQERGPKFWENKITIFMKNSKIFISSWNFTILQPKVHNHFQQTKNTQKSKKNHPKPWIQNHNFSRKSESELDHFKA